MTEPLVTCLCITRNRVAWLPAAIERFRAQTYPNKELLIVADSLGDLPAIEDRRNITAVTVKPDQNIGFKRNLGCELRLG